MKRISWVVVLVFLVSCRSHTVSSVQHKQDAMRETEHSFLSDTESQLQHTVQEHSTQEGMQTLVWDTFVIRYDTALPLDSLSGLPPIKEIIQQISSAEMKQSGESRSQNDMKKRDQKSVFSTEDDRTRQQIQEAEKKEKIRLPLDICLLVVLVLSLLLLQTFRK